MTMEEGKSLGHRILRVLVWMLLPYLMLGAFYLLVVFRLQLRPINDVVRLFNKRLLNPVMMALDRRHWYAAVLKHRGRRSGNEYTTPVTVGRAVDSFVIPLSYGEEVDWLKNVRADGRCTIETRNGTYVVGDPEVIDRAHAFAIVPRHARLMFKLFGIERYVKMKQTSKPSAEAKAAADNSRGEEGQPTLTHEYRHAKSKPSSMSFGD
jgi:deazaflavin-dependent oxidoreductase (nitroreductase family)